MEQNSSTTDKTVKNFYTMKTQPAQGDAKIWKGTVEIARLPVVSVLWSLWFKSQQPQRKGEGQEAAKTDFCLSS